MDAELVRLHLLAGKYCGKWFTCDGKVAHDTEEIATKVATKMNGRPEGKKRYDVEAYPCAFCNKWHVGRKMTIEELKELEKRSMN